MKIDILYFFQSYFVPFIIGVLSCVIYDVIKKRFTRARQEQFLNELDKTFKPYVDKPPLTEEHMKERQEIVKSNVERLSRKYFRDDEPQISSARLENTKYPAIKCKWCHDQHTPSGGSCGKCTNCKLPMDAWVGA